MASESSQSKKVLTMKKMAGLFNQKNGNKSTDGDSSANDDIWDDKLLIKAYDKAVQIAQESCTKKRQISEAVNSKGKKWSEQKWKIGDKCRCQYSQDLKYYEADIIELQPSTGTCTVRYVGYENEEEVSLKKLKPSKGESFRIKQCKEALQENDDQSNAEMGASGSDAKSTGKKSQPVQKKSFNSKKSGQFDKKSDFSENNIFGSLNFPLPEMANSIIPPPPPPHMFSRFSEDESETEAMSAMLISWYMSGYHTGYYQGLKMAKKQ